MIHVLKPSPDYHLYSTKVIYKEEDVVWLPFLCMTSSADSHQNTVLVLIIEEIFALAQIDASVVIELKFKLIESEISCQ